jgi:mRNA interferase RelE/StbE
VYDVYIETAAERDLRRLHAEVFQRIIPRIQALAQNPRPPGCRELAGSENDWRIRVGAYRVLYEIDEAEEAVRILRIRHRREAYR